MMVKNNLVCVQLAKMVNLPSNFSSGVKYFCPVSSQEKAVLYNKMTQKSLE